MHDAGDRNHRIVFALRPGGALGPESFGADTTAVPTPGPGQFLSRTLYLSIDPAVRLNPGDVVGGETVAQILESRHRVEITGRIGQIQCVAPMPGSFGDAHRRGPH